MTAPPDQIDRYRMRYGRMTLSSSGLWVRHDDHTAAIAAAEARGLRMAASVCDAIDNQCGMEAGLAASCRDAILALIPAPPAPKETPDE